ncbi:hypothetical protein [uncultured Sphingomonas sp.]|uniref:hypothetical protein n=1 Tax=uncultured Sphingomonas sp. TaxID=158754 RepID=UPI0025CE35F2|nr:hypothetical protein [uncultured Sphingomonas sp.]
MEYWIIYDLATGQPFYPGSGQPGTAAYQQVPEGFALVVVPAAVMTAAWPALNLDPLRAAMMMEVDNEAELVRRRFITALPGQVGAYLLKANAARRWLADHAASTAMLQPEASARGMTLEALCAEVLQREADWEQAAGPIESIRLAAKDAIVAAPTLGAIVAARQTDWSSLDAATGV